MVIMMKMIYANLYACDVAIQMKEHLISSCCDSHHFPSGEQGGGGCTQGCFTGGDTGAKQRVVAAEGVEAAVRAEGKTDEQE